MSKVQERGVIPLPAEESTGAETSYPNSRRITAWYSWGWKQCQPGMSQHLSLELGLLLGLLELSEELGLPWAMLGS